MDKIQNAKELKNLLSKQHFTVNYYQREYRWGRKQIEQLVDDLTNSFLDYYNGRTPEGNLYEHISPDEVKTYGYYYMGSIIRTAGEKNEIIDGQQRLTSLTLFLIYLKNLVKEKNDAKLIELVTKTLDDLIYSLDFTKMNFNISVPERDKCLTNLFDNNLNFIPENESSETMKLIYQDIKRFVVETQRATTSLLQRKFSIGYVRAARMIDRLEEEGIVGPAVGAKPREVLVKQLKD